MNCSVLSISLVEQRQIPHSVLLHLLCGADEHTARIDYLASEMDTRPELFDLILEVVKEKGGVVPYLNSCGVPDFQIQQIRSRLCLPQMN